MTTIPCGDCIDGISPYSPENMGYVYEIPYTTSGKVQVGYDVATNKPAAQICGSSGDMNLGIIPARCVNPPKAAPVSVTGTPYVLLWEDCDPDHPTQECLGPRLGVTECVLPGGQTTSYGSCGAGSTHQWWVRDWITEMAKPGPTGQAYETMGDYCCFLPPGNLPDGSPRSALCPPNLWYGSSQCQGPAENQCSNDPSSSWDAGCDNYVQQNIQTAQGTHEFGQSLFVSTVADWASQFTPNPSLRSRNSSKKKFQRIRGSTPTIPNPNDPFIQTIFKWSSSFPGMLTPSLTTACANVTRTQIGADTTGNLAKLCSCYLPPEQYYLPGVIPKECDSLCSLAGSTGGIPIYEWGSDGVPKIKSCEQTTCVIDGVTLNYANTVSGNMQWSQVCGSCPSGGCTCIVDGINVNSINSNIPGVNINQECGSFAAANGGIVPPVSPKVMSFWDTYKYWILSIIGLALGLVMFLFIKRIK